MRSANDFRLMDALPRAAALAAVLALAGCAASAPQRPAVSAVQDENGFVITEEVRVSPEVRTDYQQAIELLQQEHYAQGIALMVRVAERAPDVTAAHIDLGIAYRQAGELEKAEAALAHALDLNPQHPVAHNEMGMLCRRTGRFQAARTHYEQVLELYPAFHFARRNLAVLCDIYLGDLQCALQHYQLYTEAVPDDEEAAMWVADLRNRAGHLEE